MQVGRAVGFYCGERIVASMLTPPRFSGFHQGADESLGYQTACLERSRGPQKAGIGYLTPQP
jgi:hypothetical protein